MSNKYYSDEFQTLNTSSRSRNLGEVGTSTRFHQYAVDWVRDRVDETAEKNTTYLGGHQPTGKTHNSRKGDFLFSFHHPGQETGHDAIASLTGIKIKGDGLIDLKNRGDIEAFIRVIGPSTIDISGPRMYDDRSQSEISYIGKGLIGYAHLNGHKKVEMGQRLRVRAPDFKPNGDLDGDGGYFRGPPKDGELPLILEPVEDDRKFEYLDITTFHSELIKLTTVNATNIYLDDLVKSKGTYLAFMQASQLLNGTTNLTYDAIEDRLKLWEPVVNNYFCNGNSYFGDHLEVGFAACPANPGENISIVCKPR